MYLEERCKWNLFQDTNMRKFSIFIQLSGNLLELNPVDIDGTGVYYN